MYIKELKVTQSCLTHCDPMDYRVHGILQARILQWVAILFSRGYSQPGDWTQVSIWVLKPRRREWLPTPIFWPYQRKERQKYLGQEWATTSRVFVVSLVIKNTIRNHCPRSSLHRLSEKEDRKRLETWELRASGQFSWDTTYFWNVSVYSVQAVQLLSRVWPFATPWTAAHEASLSFTNSLSLFKLMSIELVKPSNHLILCHPFSSCLQSFPASNESFQMSQFFASGGQSIEVSSSSSVLPMNIQNWFPLGWTGWISLQTKVLSRVPWVLLQHHSSKASILQHSAFFIVQLSHPYMTIGKTIALTRWTFVGQVMSLLFNILSSWS